jgi:crotonobetainyl-CoA:carnitine CoA-transferase CaiB-like acyl-CoA transferase
MGGIMAITGLDPSTPTKVGPGVGDIVPGMMLAFGVLSAVHHAKRTGQGQFVDVAMIDAVLAVCERAIWQHSVQGLTPGPEGNHHPFLCPFGMFPAADGFITIAAQQDSFFKILCDSIGAKAISADPRYADSAARSENRRTLIDLLVARLGGRIPFGPVMNIAEIERDPHFAARQMVIEVEQPGAVPIRIAGVPIKMTATPGGVHARAPLLGEHTRAQLERAGLSDAEIQILIDGRAAAAADSQETIAP